MNKVETISGIIRSRRAIFPAMYTGEKVPEDKVWELLENANWAPTHRLTEPWFFIVIPQEKIHKLCEFGAAWYKEYTLPEVYSEMKYQKIKTKALSASHIIAICMKRDPEKRVPKWEEEAAVACAVQNMWLTASAMGLGSYWSTPGYALNSKEFFNLKKGERCLGLFYVGVPEEGLKLESRRQDVKSKVRWFE